MSKFSFEGCDIKDAVLIKTTELCDSRGYFNKYFEAEQFKKGGVAFNCSEAFATGSVKKVVRGMHFQTKNPQAKLIGVMQGSIYDVVVDLRKGSPTYGRWRGMYLSAENRNMLFVPRGCAHGFVSLGDFNMVNYFCDGAYDPRTDTGIYFNDKDVGIIWPIPPEEMIVSDKDKHLQSLEDFTHKHKGL